MSSWCLAVITIYFIPQFDTAMHSKDFSTVILSNIKTAYISKCFENRALQNEKDMIK